MFTKVALLQALAGSALAGTVIWDGRFNEMADSSYLDKWSWSNQIPPYQYYIHGSGTTSKYVNLSPSYKNPADTVSNQGVKISIDNTAYWNGQNMRRTELIPQTSAAINKGHVYYHFSVKRTNTNAPNPNLEHQVNFFESHFVELKYGTLSGQSGTDGTLKFCVGGSCKWNTPFEADVWHNVAYDINFDTNQVSFYHSVGSAPLTLTSGPYSVSTSSNGADWHLGVLRLPGNSALNNPDTEDWYFSGVYVESGSLTTAIGSGSGPVDPVPTTTSVRPVPTTTTTSVRPVTTTTSVRPVTTTTSVRPTTTMVTTTRVVTTTTRSTTTSAQPTTTQAAAGTVNQWGQCGGIGYSGSTGCVAPYTCKVLNPYYSQCL